MGQSALSPTAGERVHNYSLKNNGTLWESSGYYPVKWKMLTLNSITPGYHPRTFMPGNIRIFIPTLSRRGNKWKESK